MWLGVAGASGLLVLDVWESCFLCAGLQADSGGASQMGWAGAARQPEVIAWSQTGLSNSGWDE